MSDEGSSDLESSGSEIVEIEDPVPPVPFLSRVPDGVMLYMLSIEELAYQQQSHVRLSAEVFSELTEEHESGIFEEKWCVSFTGTQLESFLERNDLVMTRMWGTKTPGIFRCRISPRPILTDAVARRLLTRRRMLAYPLEIASYNGNNSTLFCYILSRVLGPAVNKKIILNVPHGSVSNWSKIGGFQVYIWSSPHENARRDLKPPRTIWGTRVSCRDAAFALSSIPPREGSVRIMSDKYCVAELFENALYVHHDIVEQGDNAECTLFAKLLEKVAEILRSPETFQEALRATQAEYARFQEESFLELVQKSIVKRQDRRGASRDAAEKCVVAAREALFAAERDLFSLGAASMSPEEAAEKFRQEWDKLQNGRVAFVKDARLEFDYTADSNEEGGVSARSLLTVNTEEILAMNSRTQEHHRIGYLRFIINLGSGKARVINSDTQLEGKMQAPHVNENGKVCLGSIQDELASYLAHYEIEAAVTLLISLFRQGVDPGDQWGEAILNFPVVKPTINEAMILT